MQMDFFVNYGEKEMEVIAWLLKTRTKTNVKEFCKGFIAGVFVLGALIYDLFFYSNKTTAQWVTLLILVILCMGKAILGLMGIVDYKGIAESKNRRFKGKSVRYTFGEEEIICSSDMGKSLKKWSDVIEWGEYNGCVFLMLKSNDAIIINEDASEMNEIEELKKMLRQKINNNQE